MAKKSGILRDLGCNLFFFRVVIIITIIPPTPELNKCKDEEILAISVKKPSFFGLLVDRYQRAFLRTAFNIVNQKEEAEDIVQESFTKIYLNAEKFKKIEGKTFKSWAYKIVINTSLTHYNKIKKKSKYIGYLDDYFYQDAMDNVYEERLEPELDTKIVIEKTLVKMPKHLQGVLKKYYLEDKSQKDIAQEEKVSVATVKMRLFRARRSFKKILCNDKILCPITFDQKK